MPRKSACSHGWEESDPHDLGVSHEENQRSPPRSRARANSYDICSDVISLSETEEASGDEIPASKDSPRQGDSTQLVRVSSAASRRSSESFEMVESWRSMRYSQLQPANGLVPPTASSQWTLSASVQNLYGTHLANFFRDEKGEDTRDSVASVLGGIGIQQLDITYTYEKSGDKSAASKFDIAGTLILGDLRLRLEFHNDKGAWSFLANARLDDNKAVSTTVGKVLRGIGSEGLELPGFISDIEIKLDEKDSAGIILNRVEPADKTSPPLVVLIAWFEVSSFRFQFIQLRETKKKGDKNPAPVKRALLSSITGLPTASVPLLGDLTQPFDEAIFLWVQQKASKPGAGGLVKDDLDKINESIQSQQKADSSRPVRQLLYKKVKKDPKPQDILIAAGMHFMLLLKNSRGSSDVALDYVFKKKKKPASLAEGDSQVEDEGSGTAAYQKDIGVFSLKNVGFKYSDGPNGDQSILSIKLDASVKIGPLDFALQGLTLDLRFAKDLNLKNLPSPSARLEGLAAEFDRDPLTVGGMLRMIKTERETSYAGAVSLGFNPWQFQAAGYYGMITAPTTGPETYKSAFLYCILNGPLITLSFATIGGVCGGFGYNSSLTLPTAQNVPNFPLIKPPAGSKQNPRSAIEELLSSDWFNPKNGSFWIGAGLSVTAFQMLSVQAVVLVQWDPAVKLALAALATASFPGGKIQRKFAHVELGMTAVIDMEAGIMRVDAELTPASYILDPSCHLTGGFAFYSWFDSKDANNRGDWVFSIGGFHPRYQRPPQYPNPPRLGISWQFDKSISISGKAYFAITPKVCMGGGRLDVSLSLPPLYAYFNAFVDFLINYRPFYFMAEGGLTVGVKFVLDLLFVSIPINIEIGATLYIAGPPIRGTVYVNFYVFGFNVNFGPKDVDQSMPLTIDEFVALVCQPSSPATMPLSTMGLIDQAVPASDSPEAHVFAVETGLVPDGKVDSRPSGEPWTVSKATFSFAVNCKIAAEAADVVTLSQAGKEEARLLVPGTGQNIYARPMHTQQPIKSKLTISLQPNGLKQSLPNVPVWGRNTAITKDVPQALWGRYDPSSDPSSVRNPDSLMNGNDEKTVSLLMGVRLSQPLPLESEDTTIVTDVKKFQVQDLGTKYNFPAIQDCIPGFAGEKLQDEEPWERAAEVWTSPLLGGDAGKHAAGLWMEIGKSYMGWDEAKMKDLTGAPPRRVLDSLKLYYPGVPMISKG
ncbi:hypothetical protein BDW62DRAFT_196833 [Aspergillus aurantiobrunneus]